MNNNNRLYFMMLLGFLMGFVTICTGENVKKSVDENRDDNGDINDEAKDESLDIPTETEVNNVTCTRRQNSRMHEIRSATYKQFPFMAALMSDSGEYLCSGSVVSNGLVLTTAHCIQKSIGYVLLNTTKAKKGESAAILPVIRREKFPTFAGSESTKDVGILYTEKHNNTIASKIKLSNFSNGNILVDIEVIGFGVNADVGQIKELQSVGLEHRTTLPTTEILKGYIDCIDTKILTCFKDIGGPVINANELVGIVVKGQDDCTKEMSSVYSLNKKMVDFLPTYTFKAWLDEKIRKNEEQEKVVLATYPSKPIVRHTLHKMTNLNAGSQLKITTILIFILFPLLEI